MITQTLTWRRARFFVFASLAALCCLSSTASADTKSDRSNEGPLFKIQRNGHTGWLFGTVPYGAPNALAHNKLLAKAYLQSGAVAVESDPRNDPQKSEDLAPELMKIGTYKHGQSLKKDVSPEMLRQLLTLVHNDTQLYEQMLETKPWLIALQLTVNYLKELDYSTTDGAARQLVVQAGKDNLPVRELTDPLTNLQLLSNIPIPIQVEMLQDAINTTQKPEANGHITQALTLWQKGDIEGLARLVYQHRPDGLDKQREYCRVHMIEERNPGMVDAIEPMLNSHTTYVIAIDTLRLAGPKSIPALLQKKGYIVTRVN